MKKKELTNRSLKVALKSKFKRHSKFELQKETLTSKSQDHFKIEMERCTLTSKF